MKIALLSCGQSILTHWSNSLRSSYDLTIGVNWTVDRYKLDWLVALDTGPILHAIANGNASCALYHGVPPPHVAKTAQAASLPIYDARPLLHDDKGNKCTYTTPNAIAFALRNWPDSILHIYGLDMDDRPNLNGHRTRNVRASDIWTRERKWIAHICYPNAHRIALLGCKADIGL